MRTSHDIRRDFVDFFVARHGHVNVVSSPVVPHDDPTLLFANAGMNQFKPYFLGTERPSATRVANTQKCIRAGGKHNDLDDVGKDTYHHTFFEMLGNWSFGDYFKQEAIDWAWELLVKVWGLEPDRLHATYFGGDASENLAPDDEAKKLWEKYLPPSRIHPGSKKDNFWEMGDTGPCGPCSEIHYDGTPGKSGGHLVNAGNPDVIEIWNLVFIQFNRNQSGKLEPLPAKHVDTGMGFERIVRVLQGKNSNYDTDVFTPIFSAIQRVTRAAPYTGELEKPADIAYRVIADHIRTLTFALTDGAHCGNDGRNYVLRRILRRAVRYGRQTLGVKEAFFHQLVPTVVDTMGGAFPELKKNPDTVMAELRDEEESFGRTLDRGIALFDHAAAKGTVSAEDAFQLHDTFGFPLDLTQLMAQERGMSVDVAGFEKLMQQAREKSRSTGGGVDVTGLLVERVQKHHLPATQFLGYDRTAWTGHAAAQLFDLGEVKALTTDQTPFYAESGGQVGDTGVIRSRAGTFIVRDTQRIGDVVFHLGQGDVDVKGELVFEVDASRRAAIAANHTSTHVMNRALRDLVNPDTMQRGSLVDNEKLRFDFAHDAALTDEQLQAVDEQVNADIAADLPVYAQVAPQEKALKIRGLRAVFGEKYPPHVRVVAIGEPPEAMLNDPDNAQWATRSVEFCGGTHLTRTGQAKRFHLVSQESVSRGVRRVTAVTGDAAVRSDEAARQLLHRIESLKAAPVQELETKVEQLARASEEAVLPLVAKRAILSGLADLTHRLRDYQKAQGSQAEQVVVEQARRLADAASGPVIVAQVPGADGKSLRTAMDVFRKKHPDAAVFLAAVDGDKVALMATSPKPLIDRGLKAGDWIKHVAPIVGGAGGGRPDSAQAGGKDPAKVGEAIKAAQGWAGERV